MRTRKRIEIEIQTERVLFVGARAAFGGVCAVCGGRRLTIAEAARFSHLDANTIHQLLEAGRLHSQVTPENLLVCLASLWASAE